VFKGVPLLESQWRLEDFILSVKQGSLKLGPAPCGRIASLEKELQGAAKEGHIARLNRPARQIVVRGAIAGDLSKPGFIYEGLP
jgi:hypothetical protein